MAHPPRKINPSPYNHLEELQQFQRIKRRDAAAFDALFCAYHARLCSFSYAIVKSSETAKEIVQTLFQKLWEDAGNLQIKTSVKAYLYQSVRNLSIDYLRQQRSRRTYIADEEAGPEPASPENLEELIHNKQLVSVVQESVEKLPERCKLIFRMYWEEGLSRREIAAVLNLSPKTVETQMGRALKALRKHLTPYLSSVLILRFFVA
ncbi:MAG: RNA polymerase sigma-70 factor [Ignavibacteriales bacterium]|nr:RNA polymerase sigma-70 factor [Ignavibacteriales bacterium]